MSGVDEIGKMRRAHFREGHSIKGATGIWARRVRRSGRFCGPARRSSFASAGRSRVRRSALGSRSLTDFWRRTRRVRSAGFSRWQLAELAVQVSRRRKEIERAWHEHFRWSKNGFF